MDRDSLYFQYLVFQSAEASFLSTNYKVTLRNVNLHLPKIYFCLIYGFRMRACDGTRLEI